MNRLDASKFCKLDFTVNFGVPLDVKSNLSNIIESGEQTKDQMFDIFAKLDTMVLLKLHKYFFWADKKLHSVFYIEDKQNISEDLLIDFKSEEDQQKFKKSTALGSKKTGVGIDPQDVGKEQKQTLIDVDRSKKVITKDDLVFGHIKKKKTVNIKDDEDFPDLGSDDEGL